MLKSGGGFFPRQRLESAHTAFLVVVSRLDFVSSLEGRQNIWVMGKHALLR